MPLLLISLYFLGLLILTRCKLAQVPGHVLYLFRAFFPSWKFFDNSGGVPHLFYRLSTSGEDWGDWLPGIPPSSDSKIPRIQRPERHWTAIFLNPRGNLYLACTSLLQQLVAEIEECSVSNSTSGSETLEQSVVYQLIHQVVYCQISSLRKFEENLTYQFKITVVDNTPAFGTATDPNGSHDLLLSPFYSKPGSKP